MGIVFHKQKIDKSLSALSHEFIDTVDKNLPDFPKVSNGANITGFVDAAFGTDLQKRQSISGY